MFNIIVPTYFHNHKVHIVDFDCITCLEEMQYTVVMEPYNLYKYGMICSSHLHLFYDEALLSTIIIT